MKNFGGDVRTRRQPVGGNEVGDAPWVFAGVAAEEGDILMVVVLNQFGQF